MGVQKYVEDSNMNTNEVLNKLITEIERLINTVEKRINNNALIEHPETIDEENRKYLQKTRESKITWLDGQEEALKKILSIIASLQQDKDVLDLCSQVWWEDRGWIMIPPNVTLKGIENLLERVRDKIKWNEENGIKEQEQPEVDLKIEIGHWLDKLDDKYCMLVEDYSIQDIKDTARYFAEWGAIHLNARKEE